MPAQPETSAVWRKILASPTLRNARAEFVYTRDLAKELFNSPVLELKFRNGTSVATRVAEACANRLPTVDPSVFDPCWIHGDDGNDFVYCFVCEKAFAGKHMNRLMARHPTTDRHLRAIATILRVDPACLKNMLDCPVKGCIWTASGERMDTMQLHYKKMHLGYPPNHKLTLEEKTELYRLLNEAENPPADKATEGTEMYSSPMELDEPDHDDDRLDQHSAELWTSGATDMDVRGPTVTPGRYAHSTPGSRASSVMSTTSSESISSRSSSPSATTAMDVDYSDEEESPALSRHAATMKVHGRARSRSRDRPAVDEGDDRGRSRTRTPLQSSVPGSQAEYWRKRVDCSAARAHPSRRYHLALPTHLHPSQLIAPYPSPQLQGSDGDSSDVL